MAETVVCYCAHCQEEVEPVKATDGVLICPNPDCEEPVEEVQKE